MLKINKRYAQNEAQPPYSYEAWAITYNKTAGNYFKLYSRKVTTPHVPSSGVPKQLENKMDRPYHPVLPCHNDPQDVPFKQETLFEPTNENPSLSFLVSRTPETHLNSSTQLLPSFPIFTNFLYTAD